MLCQEHFKHEDLKRNPQQWKLHHGAVPLLKLYNSDARTSKMSRKAPKDRSHYYEFPQPQPSSSATSELNDCSDSIQEDFSNYSNSSTQTSFYFVLAPVYFDDDSSDDENRSSKEQREYVNLQKKIDEISFQISNLNAELSGFDIADILPVGVTLNIPPFKGSRSQLTPAESEETAQIAAVRIHVERAIVELKITTFSMEFYHYPYAH